MISLSSLCCARELRFSWRGYGGACCMSLAAAASDLSCFLTKNLSVRLWHLFAVDKPVHSVSQWHSLNLCRLVDIWYPYRLRTQL